MGVARLQNHVEGEARLHADEERGWDRYGCWLCCHG